MGADDGVEELGERVKTNLTSMCRPAREDCPNLETPGPGVALDTPEDPEGTQEVCILHSLGLSS